MTGHSGPQRIDPASATFAPLGAGAGRPAAIRSQGLVADLVSWLLSPHRSDPVIVISIGAGGPAPWIDAQRVAGAGTVAVYVVQTGHLTWTMAELLPPRCDVYGGAARFYPAGTQWTTDPARSPLALCRSADEAAVATGRILSWVRPTSDTPGRGGRPGAAATPDGRPHAVSTAEQAIALAGHLLAADRRYPIVVVTNATGRDPYLDPERIASDLQDLADVFVLANGAASWAFTGHLPDKTGVFGGAARVYPPGTDWIGDLEHAPLLFCWDGLGADRIAGRVIDEAIGAAHAAGLVQAAAPSATGQQVTATVTGALSDHHVLLRLPSGAQAVLVSDSLCPGVPADRLVARGMQVSGSVDTSGGHVARFTPAPVDDDPRRRVAEVYPTGSVVLARVDAVTEQGAQVALHPQVTLRVVPDEDGPPLVRLLSVDDVVLVVLQDAEGGLACTLADTEEQQPLPGIPVLPGGPAWLRTEDLVDEAEPGEASAPVAEPGEARAPVAEPGVASAPVAEPEVVQTEAGPRVEPVGVPSPGPIPTADQGSRLQALEGERDAFAHRASQLSAEVERMRREASVLRRDLRDARKAVKSANAQAEQLQAASRGTGVFADPIQQMRHEIWLAYLARIPDGQRRTTTLAEYSFGPSFVDSVERLEGISRTKIVDVLVEVLTGLAQDLPSRQLHPWLTSVAGRQEVRADGGRAWRCSLQIRSASARRLKYWVVTDGSIEFDSVGVHDDGL